jgi:hypothetical protein
MSKSERARQFFSKSADLNQRRLSTFAWSDAPLVITHEMCTIAGLP